MVAPIEDEEPRVAALQLFSVSVSTTLLSFCT
jgi:hypothetical protein